VEILDGLAGWNSFEVTDEGIYFLGKSAGSGGSIEFFHFASRKSQQIAAIDRPLGGGISVLPRPRGRFSEILYTQVDHQGSDLMLVENIR
jgi:hypothetical protein